MRNLCLLIVLLLTSLATAQRVVKWSLVTPQAEIKAGTSTTVTVEAEIQKGWHLYSIKPVSEGPLPTTFKAGDGVELTGAVEESKATTALDKNFGKDVFFFEDKATFKVPVKLPATGGAEISVRYQTCNERQCSLPQTAKIPLLAGSVGSSAGSPAPKMAVNSVNEARKKGLIFYLQAAVTAGFLALLTPCVFPMIPITVSFFSKRKKEHGLKDSIGQALAYCFGIIGTFTGLGIIVAVLFGAAGIQSLANNPWVNLVLAAIFIVLACSLFGAFEIGLPSKFVNRFNASGKSGIIAPIFMGSTFSLTSFTCTLPFVGAVLVSASQGDYLYPILGMLGFSSAFCLPFFALALFPQAVSKLPKSGAWMVTVKAVMGFVELMAAVKFLSSFDLGIGGGLGILTRPVYLAIWFMLAVAAAAYILGLIQLPKVEEGKIGMFRRAIGLVALLGAGYIAAGLNGRPLGALDSFLPPTPYPSKAKELTVTDDHGVLWYLSYAGAQAAAKREGKPIFIDFTGIYCTNCRFMESNVFPNAGVQAELKNFVHAKLFTDRDSAEDKANQDFMAKLTGSVTLPTYVTVKADGTVAAREFTGDAGQFVKFLQAGR